MGGGGSLIGRSVDATGDRSCSSSSSGDRRRDRGGCMIRCMIRRDGRDVDGIPRRSGLHLLCGRRQKHRLLTRRLLNWEVDARHQKDSTGRSRIRVG